MNTLWKDITSYNQRDTKQIPTTFKKTYQSGLEIIICNKNIYHPGMWVMACYEIGIDREELGSTNKMTQFEAQQEAIRIVYEKVKNWYDDICPE